MTNRIPFLPGASRSEAQKFTMNFSAKWSINSQKVSERGRGRENWAQKQIRPDQTSNLTEQTERNHIHRPKTVGGVLMSMQRAACNMGQEAHGAGLVNASAAAGGWFTSLGLLE